MRRIPRRYPEWTVGATLVRLCGGERELIVAAGVDWVDVVCILAMATAGPEYVDANGTPVVSGHASNNSQHVRK